MPADDLLALPDNEDDDGGVDEQHEREKGSEKSPRLLYFGSSNLLNPHRAVDRVSAQESLGADLPMSDTRQSEPKPNAR